MRNSYTIADGVASVVVDSRAYGLKVFLVDEADLQTISNRNWTFDGVYIRSTEKDARRGRVRLHVLLGGRADGLVVDHWNRNKLDNRRCNLRLITQSDNTFNQAAKNVYFHRGRGTWYVKIKFRRRVRSHGHYATKSEAERVAAEVRSKLEAGEDVAGNAVNGGWGGRRTRASHPTRSPNFSEFQ